MFFICFIRRGMLNFFHKLIRNMGMTMLLYAFFVSHASLCSFSGKKKHIKSLSLRKNICFFMQNQAISRYRAQIKICLNQLLYAFSLDTISRVKFCLPSGIDYPVRSFMVADFLIKIIVAAGHNDSNLFLPAGSYFHQLAVNLHGDRAGICHDHRFTCQQICAVAFVVGDDIIHQ